MPNYLLKVQYDGTNFAGWQIQKNADSVQGRITSALEILFKEKINLIGSGRTDAGVHAWGQVANFRASVEKDSEKLHRSLNGMLPPEIRIKSIFTVPEEFHARFDAKRRIYIYVLSTSENPFFRKYCLFKNHYSSLNISGLNSISEKFIGKKDFSSFSRKICASENKLCDVTDARWYRKGDFVFFRIEADRFLHGMVRAITGSVLKIYETNREPSVVSEILMQKDREAAFESVPSSGLFLFKVKYPASATGEVRNI